MRYFERMTDESGKFIETQKAWEAFKVYRDLGPTRSLRKACEAYYGSRANIARISIWSSKYDWVARVQAYDDYHEMIKQSAVEEHERRKAQDMAGRRAKVEEERLALEERHLELQKQALERGFMILNWPLEKVTTERDGKTVHIHPARWSQNTGVRIIEATNPAPAKVALTDPTGAHEYGAGDSEEEAALKVEEILKKAEQQQR